jgi:hypothetical protein
MYLKDVEGREEGSGHELFLDNIPAIIWRTGENNGSSQQSRSPCQDSNQEHESKVLNAQSRDDQSSLKHNLKKKHNVILTYHKTGIWLN